MTANAARDIRAFAQQQGIQIIENTGRSRAGRAGGKLVMELEGRIEGMDKSVVLEELQHAIDAKNGMIPIMRNLGGDMVPTELVKIIMRQNPRLGQAEAIEQAIARVHMGTFERLALNTGLPEGVLTELERKAMLLTLGVR